MHPYVSGIKKLYKSHSDAARAVPMKAYMRNQFDFIGIDSITRRALGRDYMKSKALPPAEEYPEIVRELWNLKERDFQYFAIEFAMKYRKSWGESDITLFVFMSTEKSWWDTVDYIASKLVGPWLQKHPGKMAAVTGNWNRSDNIWLQRLSLIFQLTYRNETDRELLAKYIQNLSASDEFFIRKAIGWALRQYSKVSPDWVVEFVKSNELKPLSKKEALKVISR